MARNIQPSHRGKVSAGAFIGPLVTAIFWFVIAINFPYHLIPGWLDGLVGANQTDLPDWGFVASLARGLFYVLAIWAVVRALYGLLRIAVSRAATAPRASRLPQPGSQPTQSARTADNAQTGRQRPQRTAMPAINRPPTIQRMR